MSFKKSRVFVCILVNFYSNFSFALKHDVNLADSNYTSDEVRELLETFPIHYPVDLFPGLTESEKPPGIHAELLRVRRLLPSSNYFYIHKRYFATGGASPKRTRSTSASTVEISPQVRESIEWARAKLKDLLEMPIVKMENGTLTPRQGRPLIANANHEAEAKVVSLLLSDLDNEPLDTDEAVVLRASDPMCHQCQMMAWHLKHLGALKGNYSFFIAWNGSHGEGSGLRAGVFHQSEIVLPACRGGYDNFIALNSILDSEELLSTIRVHVRASLPTSFPSPLPESELPKLKYQILTQVLRQVEERQVRRTRSPLVQASSDVHWLRSQIEQLQIQDPAEALGLKFSIVDLERVRQELQKENLPQTLESPFNQVSIEIAEVGFLATISDSRRSAAVQPLPALSACATPQNSPERLLPSAPPSVPRVVGVRVFEQGPLVATPDRAARTPSARSPIGPPSGERTLHQFRGIPCLQAKGFTPEQCAKLGVCFNNCANEEDPSRRLFFDVED